MKWLNVCLGVYWVGLGIAAWCGYVPSNFSIGCGFLCAALGSFGYALDSNF